MLNRSVVRAFSLALLIPLFGIGSVWQSAAAQGIQGDTLSLDAAIDQSLTQNFEARIAQNELEIASRNRSIGNAGLLPTLSIGGSRNTTISSATNQFLDGSEEDISGAQTNIYDAGVELQLTLFDGLGRVSELRRLGAEEERQQAQTRDTVEDILADVIITYFQVAREQQQLEVLQESVDISQERLRIAEMRRQEGTASDLEVRQARLDLNSDRSDLRQQEIALGNTKAELNRLLALREAQTEYDVRDAISFDRQLQPDQLMRTAERQNPALREARQAQRSAELERSSIQAERFPTVEATIGGNFNDLTAESGFLRASETFEFQYGLSISLDVFDGFERRRRIQNATVRSRNADLFIQEVETRIATEITSAYEEFESRLDIVEIERENLEDAEANVDLALEQFRLGTITSVELRDVQEQFIRAESRVLAAEFEAKRAETILLQLSGQLMDRYASEHGL